MTNWLMVSSQSKIESRPTNVFKRYYCTAVLNCKEAAFIVHVRTLRYSRSLLIATSSGVHVYRQPGLICTSQNFAQI